MSVKKKNKKDPQLDKKIIELQSKLAELEEKLVQSSEKEKRALADYQNLVRRNQEERLQIIKLANKELILSLIEPLENLRRAAKQIDDQGLDMIIYQFMQILKDFGVKKVEVMGQEFDEDLMEVVEKKKNGKKVIDVLRNAYKLNDKILCHARVIMD